jgi:predicted metalloprotease with PDZ domain
LRRNQDYYRDGMLFWLEADTIIRTGSGGKRSLDDVCRRLLAFLPDGTVRTYDGEAVLAALDAVHHHPWRELIERRLHRPEPVADPGMWEGCGWRLAFTDLRPGPPPEDERQVYLDERMSVGLLIRNWQITDVVVGSPADQAGLAPGSWLIAIAGEKATVAALDRALAASVDSGKIRVTVHNGVTQRDVELIWKGGARYPYLERIPERPDLLADICRPLRPNVEPQPEAEVPEEDTDQIRVPVFTP